MKKKIFILLIIFISFISIKVNAEEKEITVINKNDPSILFEGVGKYAITTAGNNLVYKGSTRELTGRSAEGYQGIFPTNKDEVLSWLPNELSSKITNLSGSKLDFDGELVDGTATLSMMKYFGSEIDADDRHYDILVIYPDHSYNIYKNAHDSKRLYKIDLKGSGWYYVSLLLDEDHLFNQDAWAITAIYENQSLPIRYLKLLNSSTYLNSESTTSAEIKFESKLNLTDNFQLFGVILGAGVGAWQDTGESNDTAEAILDDGTYKFLYETEYNGKTIFKDRQKENFARNVYSAERNPSSDNTWGGELDIFNETLSDDFFDNKSIIGYRFVKYGNAYTINLLGLAQAIEIPEYTIDAEIEKTEAKDVLQNRITIKNVSPYSSCLTELTIPFGEGITSIDESSIVVTPKIDKENIKVDKDKKVITIKLPEVVKNGAEYKINYLSTVDSSKDQEVTLDPTLTYYPANGTSCLSDITSNEKYRYSVSAHDMNKVVSTKVEQQVVAKTVVEVPNTSLSATEGLVVGTLLVFAGTTLIVINLNNKAKIKIKNNESRL